MKYNFTKKYPEHEVSMKWVGLNTLVDRFWPVGRMFDTSDDRPNSCQNVTSFYFYRCENLLSSYVSGPKTVFMSSPVVWKSCLPCGLFLGSFSCGLHVVLHTPVVWWWGKPCCCVIDWAPCVVTLCCRQWSPAPVRQVSSAYMWHRLWSPAFTPSHASAK